MCQSCEVLNINGMNCHEIGCPEAWRDYAIKCHECQKAFKPKEREQVCCTKRCKKIFEGRY